jgi:hypothetical protein
MSESNLPEARWSLPTRIAFRFFFALLVIFYFPFPLTAVPFIAKSWSSATNKLLAAAGRLFFGITLDVTYNGSGDKPIDWARFLVIVVLAVIVTIVWSIADRKRASYPRLHHWFHVYIRFGLATAMIIYGTYKVIPTQFVTPSLERLMEPIGDQSPMGMLWTFMGASVPYTIFGGLGELIGGLLLANRRTALLGALITAGVMSQVVMLNFSYDVPVKIYSSVLLLTALVIAAPDAKKLLQFFLLDPAPKSHLAFRIVAALFIVYVVVMRFHDSWKDRREYYADLRAPSPIAGIWNVDEMTIDGVAHPPLMTDSKRWRRLMIEGKEDTAIQNMDDSRARYWMTLDEKKKTIALQRRASTLTLNYDRPDAQTLLLNGVVDGKKITATLHKNNERTFLLTTRGFHWINERPFNR